MISARAQLLREASVLKMRAMRLRAVGDTSDHWESVRLFHRAARKELEALAALSSPSTQEQEGACIEACGLFLQAMDPVRAAEQWGKLPLSAFTSASSAAGLAELSPYYERQITEFSHAWRALSGGVPGAPDLSSLREDQLSSLVGKYPGVAELWWALSQRAGDGRSAQDAQAKMLELDSGLEQEQVARQAWERIERLLVSNFSVTLKTEKPGGILPLDLVNRIAAAFGEILSSFAEGVFGTQVDLLPAGARVGSYIVDIAAQGLPPHALEALARGLEQGDERIDARRLGELLALLQQNEVRLTVRAAIRDESTRPVITIDRGLRKRLLKATDAASLRTVESRDVPQADSLDRVFLMVERASRHLPFTSEEFEITPRQVNYYRRAAQILGFLTESGEVTAAGRLIARLGGEERLRATVVHFESSRCGDAWIQWSRGKTLLDVRPESAHDFLAECVPGLSQVTVGRRVKTLVAWYRALRDHHYIKQGSW